MAKFGFASRKDCCKGQSPAKFEFVGSNDCKSWRVIGKYSTIFTKLNQRKTWVIPKRKRKRFRCFGIRVLKNLKGPTTAIRGVKMWRPRGEFLVLFLEYKKDKKNISFLDDMSEK